ncbi:hypothetical protein ACFQRC_12310 [Enterovirga sp. GCM10030262]|uniref:hypothetical protein n=1 Tax=Enterovirga sp. GCM10030262 TaxID=3273391 RepID=UPI00361B63AB
MPEELERGKVRARRIPLWGCALFVAVLALGLYALYRLAIWLGFAWSGSLLLVAAVMGLFVYGLYRFAIWLGFAATSDRGGEG